MTRDSERPRILIVDDEPMVRRSIRRLLSLDLKHAVFGEAGTAAEALERARDAEWDVVMLDISMPGQSGLAAIGPLKALRPDLVVIVASGLPEDPYAELAVRAGASVYIHKEQLPERIAQTIRSLLGPDAPAGGT